jgi:hypothetical protein
MGELLALSLVCTLAAAALFQPILMGKPRKVPEDAAAPLALSHQEAASAAGEPVAARPRRQARS